MGSEWLVIIEDRKDAGDKHTTCLEYVLLLLENGLKV